MNEEIYQGEKIIARTTDEDVHAADIAVEIMMDIFMLLEVIKIHWLLIMIRYQEKEIMIFLLPS